MSRTHTSCTIGIGKIQKLGNKIYKERTGVETGIYALQSLCNPSQSAPTSTSLTVKKNCAN